MHRSSRLAVLGALCLSLAVTAAGCGGGSKDAAGPTSDGPTSDGTTADSPAPAGLLLQPINKHAGHPAGTFSSCAPTSTYKNGVWMTIFSVHATTRLTITAASAGAGAPAPADVALVRVKRVPPTEDQSAAITARLFPHQAWADRSRLTGDGVSMTSGEDAVLTFREPLQPGQSFSTDQVSLTYRTSSGQATATPTGLVPEKISVENHCGRG